MYTIFEIIVINYHSLFVLCAPNAKCEMNKEMDMFVLIGEPYVNQLERRYEIPHSDRTFRDH